MDIGRGIRRIALYLRKLGARLLGLFAGVPRFFGRLIQWRPGKGGYNPSSENLKLTGRLLILGVLLIVSFYVVGAFMVNTIDTNLDFKSTNEPTGGQSHAVAITTALIDREVNAHGWTANDPFFKPAALLDNMPNFQQGLIAALARFSFELTDQLGRTRGSSQADPDLQEASGLLQYAGDKWLWDPSVSLMPTATSEQQYRKAAKALKAYNGRLATGDAVFERRSDNLLATLDRIALDIGSSSAVIDTFVGEKSGFPFHRQADDVFYTVKGQSYGYYMILRALGEDFKDVIKERNLESSYAEMLRSFQLTAEMEPLVIMNGAPDSQIIPCHLCSQGFYLLRGRTQLREITNILLK
ncbi:MAG: DUF2333 family protein [Alphaproteobacteria bacterium]|nr:MAG: DUF2333 family protein [Alphaproteobacteria bacterium]